eukprot:2886642-Prymnesium_polylepis.1
MPVAVPVPASAQPRSREIARTADVVGCRWRPQRTVFQPTSSGQAMASRGPRSGPWLYVGARFGTCFSCPP